MTQPAAMGLSPEEVSSVFPFHLGFDEQLRLVQLGPSLCKLVPAVALGQRLTEHFAFDPPHMHAFVSLSRTLASQAVLRVRDSDASGLVTSTGVQLRGQLVLGEPRRMLFLCTPWLSSPSELPQLGLTLEDFALHDATTELLQMQHAQESILADVRKLMNKLAAQRREQRAGAARMATLQEVTSLLAAGSGLEAVAERVLERLAAVIGFPVAALWLQDFALPLVYVAPSCIADRSALQLAERLGLAALELGSPSWQPLDGAAGPAGATAKAHPFDARLVAAPPEGTLGAEAVALGYAVAYQLPIYSLGYGAGLGGVLGAFEVYGAAVPVNEPLLLETLGELTVRLGQFIEKTRADAALRGSIKVAAAAVAAKGRFLARMSQEIRAPIDNVLELLARVLGGELLSSQREQLEVARTSAELLLGLVEDVLDFSRTESGRLEIHPSAFDLHACLRRTSHQFGPRAAAKQLSLSLELDPRVPVVACGDELRISQVLVNLVGNAIKFTGAGSVHVSARLLDERADSLTLEIAVSDTGIGIAEARHAAIFAPFSRADPPTTHETGFGLSICKQLAELMGGDLTVSSTPGTGSTFRFSVLLERVSQPSSSAQSGVDEAAVAGAETSAAPARKGLI